MRRFLGRYGIELGILLLGAVVAAGESIIVDRTDIALLVGFNSFLIALAVLSLRQEISSQGSAVAADRLLIDSIPDEGWRKEAQEELDAARVKFLGWATGVRRVSEKSALNFQIDKLSRAGRSVRAIHVALRPDSLTMWTDPQRKFKQLVDAYRLVRVGIERQRILVLNREDEAISIVKGDQRTIVNDIVIQACRLQLDDPAAGGLGFDLRILWVPPGTRDISDLLILDDREAFSIDAHGHDQFGDLEVTVNRTNVDARLRQFRDRWTEALPASLFVPEGTLSSN